jgi:hypothetical protein
MKEEFTKENCFSNINNTYAPQKTAKACRKSREKNNLVPILDP